MKIFRFVKKVFFIGLTILSSFTNASFLSCISINNQACKARPEIINVNSSNPVFYLFSIKTNKCGGNCNSINDSYAKICLPDVVKDLKNKVFNLMSRSNETKNIKWHEKDYENCKCQKNLVDKSVDECDEAAEETTLVKINSTKYKHNSFILYIVLFSIIFTINVEIVTSFVYYKYVNCNKENVSKYDYVYHVENY